MPSRPSEQLRGAAVGETILTNLLMALDCCDRGLMAYMSVELLRSTGQAAELGLVAIP